MANSAGKDMELVKAPMSTTDVDSAYAPNADAALKIPDAVRAYASFTIKKQQLCLTYQVHHTGCCPKLLAHRCFLPNEHASLKDFTQSWLLNKTLLRLHMP